MHFLIVFSLLFLTFFTSIQSTASEKVNVTFVSPDENGSYFWDVVKSINNSAKESLGIELEIYYVENDRFAQQAAINDISKRAKKPDYLIFRGFYGYTIKMFDRLEEMKIPFITLEQGFSPDDAKNIGEPQDKYKYWLGQIIYDNKAGGELLLDALITEYQKNFPNEIMKIIGIGGDHEEVSQDRQFALEKLSSSNNEKIIVNQIFSMLWEPKIITERFSAMIKRYPNTNAYWCAGDQMALTVLKEHQKVSNKPLIIGGFDWTPEALKKIKTGEMTASVGGHILMVVSALIKIVDYEHGIDRFNAAPLINEFELITKANVDEYLSFIEHEQWKHVDFSVFTATGVTQPSAFTFKNMIKLSTTE